MQTRTQNPDGQVRRRNHQRHNTPRNGYSGSSLPHPASVGVQTFLTLKGFLSCPRNHTGSSHQGLNPGYRRFGSQSA